MRSVGRECVRRNNLSCSGTSAAFLPLLELLCRHQTGSATEIKQVSKQSIRERGCAGMLATLLALVVTGRWLHPVLGVRPSRCCGRICSGVSVVCGR